MQAKASLTQKDIEKYLKEERLFSSFSLRQLRSGLSNKNFLITTPGGKFNLRTNRKRPPLSKENLSNEHIILDFFKSKNIGFASRSFYYDKEENIHIVKYLDGRKINLRDLSDKNLKAIINYLYQVNLMAGEFNKFLRARNLKFKPPQTSAQLLILIKQSIIKLETYPHYRFAARWANKKINKDWTKLKTKEKEIYLNHGDPMNNIIIKGSKLYLIDWEQVRLAYDHGLGYIILHGHLTKEQREKIFLVYSEISGLTLEKLELEAYKKYKQLAIYNVLELCSIHQRNIELYNSKKRLPAGLIKGRMKFYDSIMV